MKTYLLRSRILDLAVLIFSVSAAVVVVLSLGQDASWDQKNYHYYIGYALLNKPLLYDFAPAQVQSFFNPLFHVPTYLLLKYLSSKAATLILAAVQGLNVWLIYQISKKLLFRFPAWSRELLSAASAATAFYGAANISELGTTFGDNLVSVLPLLSLLWIFDRLLAERVFNRYGLGKLGLAGLIAGLACGLKLTVGVFVVPIALALLGLAVASRIRFRELAVIYGGILVGFMAAYVYWGLSLYREYRNPLYPYLNNVFRSDYYELANTMDARFLPRDWSERLFYPFYIARRNHLVSEPEFRDLRFAVCYVLAVALGLRGVYRVARRRSAQDRTARPQGEHDSLIFLTVFITFSYLLWQHFFSIYRYAVLIEFIAPVFICIAVVRLLGRKYPSVLVILAVDALICLHLEPLNFGRQGFEDGLLTVAPPPWQDLERSVVVMGGDEGTAYIIPSFPAATRFVRIQGNWIYPGNNARIDQKIREILSQYSRDRTLVYVSTREELQTVIPAVAYYGLAVDEGSCVEIRARAGNAGCLCRILPERIVETGRRSASSAEAPVFIDRPEVRFAAEPTEVVAANERLTFRVFNLKARAIDVLYTLDGVLMQPVRNWGLDSHRDVPAFVSAGTRKGLYHFIGIRDSESPAKNEWIRINLEVRIK